MHHQPDDSTQSLHVEYFRGLAGLKELRARWEALFASMGQPRFFHAYDWYDCYLRHIEERPDNVFFCCAFTKDGAAHAILPLQSAVVRLRGLETRQLRLPAHPHLPLRDILLCDDGAATLSARWLLDDLRKRAPVGWDVAAFERILPDSSARALFSASEGARTLIEHIGYCSYLPTRDVETLLSGLSRNFRSNLAKARNKLRNTDNVAFDCVRDHPALGEAFREFLELEASGWKGASGSGSAIKLSPGLTAFYGCLAERFAAQGNCEISLLREGEHAFAGQFALETKKSVYQLKIGYDEEYARLSPGSLLIDSLLRHYQQRGIECFNLVSHTDWHRNWRAPRYDLFSVYAFNTTGRGMAAYVSLRAKQVVRPAYHLIRRALKGESDAE